MTARNQSGEHEESHLEGERKKSGRGEKSGIVGKGESQNLRGFTTWTMNIKNETDQNYQLLFLVSLFFSDIFHVLNTATI